jgi:signal transduction histidine kinase
MTLRLRLFLLIALTTAFSVALATWTISTATRRSFEASDDQRTAALLEQFRREFQRRQTELVRAAERIVATEFFNRAAIDLGRSEPDLSAYVNEASRLAGEHALDVVEIVRHDGTIVSSAHWPARFGYKDDWVAHTKESTQAFLKSVDLPNEGSMLALVAVRSFSEGDKKLHIVTGLAINERFFASLVFPSGMRILLYRHLDPRRDVASQVSGSLPGVEGQRLAPVLEEVRKSAREATRTIVWPDGPETFQVIPLWGKESEWLGAFLVGSSRKELWALVGKIRWLGILAGAVGLLLGVAVSYWVARGVTRPVEHLAQVAREVARGQWHAKAAVSSRDEIGDLAAAFNSMTGQLIDQRERLIQTERVAAWRELARRLAHELKNPLFPLQITIENLRRARESAPEQFDEIFRESTRTLLTELDTLKVIIARFGDFARMPPPRFEAVDLNEIVLRAVKLFDAQFRAGGPASISSEVDCDPNLGQIEADPDLLNRALQNLILNAIDAMPAGGNLKIRTRRLNGQVHLEVSDSGGGLTQEERERLFTPYYTTKQHGTGLGLAIVQSVVSDHGGKISVESERDHGTTFRVELPTNAVGVTAETLRRREE